VKTYSTVLLYTCFSPRQLKIHLPKTASSEDILVSLQVSSSFIPPTSDLLNTSLRLTMGHAQGRML